jgi:hypothetical protein
MRDFIQVLVERIAKNDLVPRPAWAVDFDHIAGVDGPRAHRPNCRVLTLFGRVVASTVLEHSRVRKGCAATFGPTNLWELFRRRRPLDAATNLVRATRVCLCWRQADGKAKRWHQRRRYEPLPK